MIETIKRLNWPYIGILVGTILIWYYIMIPGFVFLYECITKIIGG